MHFLSCSGELNHHGKYMCDSLYNLLGNDFKRVTTSSITNERMEMGYHDFDAPYNVVKSDIDLDFIRNIIKWCDVLDYGSAPIEYLNEALFQKKVVFIRIERLFKEGIWKIFHPKVFLRYYKKYIRNRKNPNVYFLCVSAYAALDLKRIGIKGDRVLQWAYCPEFKPLDEYSFIRRNNRLELLWCGRMIKWKHPEIAIEVARELRKLGCSFRLRFIGDGPQLDNIKALIKQSDLSDCIELCGNIKAEYVRSYMIEADIFLATSDKNEGWGVVINEAMNSGCVVFATPQMGASPVLIKDGINGFFIHSGKVAMTAKQISDLDNNEEGMCKIKKAAYFTIKEDYSPEHYAKTFVDIAEDSLTGKKNIYVGLGSKAVICR